MALVIVLAVVAAFLGNALAANVGYWVNNNNKGTFYIFTNGGQGVQIYDPVANAVVKTLTNVTLGSAAYTSAAATVTTYSANCCGGASGVPSYGDAAWLKDSTGTKQYAYIAENSAYNRVHVYNVATQKYLGTIPTVSNKPLHMYSVPQRYEMWVHADISSGFDVYSPADTTKPLASLVSQMPHAGLDTGLGYPSAHGKLLWEDGLGTLAFQTNVWNGGGQMGPLQALDLNTKRPIGLINITSSSQAAPNCNFGTHGIGYNDPTKSLIVQCLGAYGTNYWIDASLAAWQKPSATRYSAPREAFTTTRAHHPNHVTATANHLAHPCSPVRIRMSSPQLTKLNGANTPTSGLNGAAWDDPTHSISLITNPTLGWGHFVMPMSSPADATPLYYVVDFNFNVDFGGTTGVINMRPDFVAWYPKDVSVPFFTDTNPANYYALVALNAQVAQSGFAIIDMATIQPYMTQAGCGSGKPQTTPVVVQVTASQIVQCGYGGGSASRLIERGGDYVMTNVYSTVTLTAVDSTCVYNMRTKAIVAPSLSAGKSAAKILYVGNGAQLGSATPITVTTLQTLTGIDAKTFLASADAMLAYRTTVATAASVSVTAVTITGATRRRTMLQTKTATVATKVTTSNPSTDAATLTAALTSAATAAAVQAALVRIDAHAMLVPPSLPPPPTHSTHRASLVVVPSLHEGFVRCYRCWCRHGD